MKNYTTIPKSNYSINTAMTIKEKILNAVKDEPYPLVVIELRALLDELSKQNSIRINKTVSDTKRKYPKK